MSEWKLKNDEFTYVLRYYLPCEPQYPRQISERRAEELIGFCIKNKIDAVMLYVDLNPYWYYMPDTKEHNAYLISLIKPLAKRLRENGISYQLNYQNLFGSWDGNCDHRDMYGWECYTDEFGEESKGVGCMIGEKFRAYAGEKLKAWAETEPDAIWIDDDIRYHNHRTEVHALWEGRASSEGRDFGCFCDGHIALFNKRCGTKHTRADIVDSLTKRSQDKSLGKKYREFLNDTLTDTSKWIEETVHSVSPDTRVAIMTSMPDVHALEGRDWGDFLSALSGEHTPLLRPTFGPYKEGDPRDFINSYISIRQLDENIKAQYKKDTDFCPEIENTRFTLYSKSAAATGYQIDLSAFLGLSGVTLSIYDLEGVILEEQPELAELLRRKKPYCDRLTKMDVKSYISRGLAFVTSPSRALSEGSRIAENVPKRSFLNNIARLGIPYTFVTPEGLASADILMLDRDCVKILTDDEIRLALTKAVMLDGGAASELTMRGFGEYLGVQLCDKIYSVAASEHIDSLKRGDGSEVYVPSRICGGSWFELKSCGAEALSHLVTPSGKEYIGFTYYENSLGGRISVYPAENNFGDGFPTDYRVELIKSIISRFCPELPVFHTRSYSHLIIREKDEKQLILFTNLSADSAERTVVELRKTPKKISLIEESGDIKELTAHDNLIRFDRPVQIYGTVTLFIEY